MLIQWENELGGCERIFWIPMRGFQAKKIKKSVRIRPIRPIRSPIVSLFSKHKLPLNIDSNPMLGTNNQLLLFKEV
jgi:hypothetical protein